jgi:hypothetical protein
MARVEANLARAEELVAANAELLVARESFDGSVRVTAADRVFALRSAERRALEFAAIHRSRGQVARAQFHEAAAEWLAFVAEVNEDDGAVAREAEASLLAKGNGYAGQRAAAEAGAAS